MRSKTYWVLLALFMAPLVQAEALLEDPAGDAETNVDTPAGIHSVPSAEGNLDLASLTMSESQEGFGFTVEFHEGPGDLQAAYVTLWTGERQYAVRLSGSGFPGYVYNVAPDGTFSRVAELAPTQVDGMALTQQVPREYLLDEDAAPPLRGTQIQDIRVYSSTGSSVSLVAVSAHSSDHMPDDGLGGAWDVAYGPLQEGDARIWSPRPSRASNGQATTYLFEAFAENAGDVAKAFRIEATGVPEHWDVRVARPELVLAPGQQAAVPVVAAVPFRHEHGATETIMIEMNSGDGDRALLPLQVRYLAVPQPSGHHDTLYLHNAETHDIADTDLLGFPAHYMNTLQEDPRDTGEPLRGRAGVVNAIEYLWTIPLAPALEIGLDPVMGQQGTLDVMIETQLPALLGNLTGTIYLSQADGWTTIARVHAEAWETPMPQQVHLELPIEFLPEGDLIHVEQQAGLILRLRASFIGIDQDIGDQLNAAILPGAWLQLPLQEYRDPIEDRLANASDVRIRGPPSLTLQPSGEFWIPLEVTNLAAEAATYDIELASTGQAEHEVTPQVQVPPGQTGTVWLHVRPGPTGERSDVVVHVASENSPGAYHRLSILFDPEGRPSSKFPAPRQDTMESPAIGALGFTGGLLVVSLMRRVRWQAGTEPE